MFFRSPFLLAIAALAAASGCIEVPSEIKGTVEVETDLPEAADKLTEVDVTGNAQSYERGKNTAETENENARLKQENTKLRQQLNAVTTSGPPEKVEVDSKQRWVDTGWLLVSTKRYEVKYISGKWKIAANVECGPDGLPSPAPPRYNAPNEPEGALVGKVGGETFLIGTIPKRLAGKSGQLQLACNDALHKQQDPEVLRTDNTGTMWVQIRELPIAKEIDK